MMDWKPYSVAELQQKLSSLEQWFYAGGHSLALALGQPAHRDHGDIDVGVFDSDATEFLQQLLPRYQLWQCTGGELRRYTGGGLLADVHNLWVSDAEAYRFEVLIYTTQGNRVTFRRNPAISWAKQDFLVATAYGKSVHPLVTYTFKVTSADFRPVDQKDVDYLMAELNDFKLS